MEHEHRNNFTLYILIAALITAFFIGAGFAMTRPPVTLPSPAPSIQLPMPERPLVLDDHCSSDLRWMYIDCD